MTVLNKLARPMLAAPFIAAGADALLRPHNHREAAAKVSGLLDKVGLAGKTGLSKLSPENTDLLTRASGLLFVGAGAALAKGTAPRSAALLLGLAQAPIALANNPFWEHSGEERRKDVQGLLGATGLVGGALIASTDRSGKPSIGWRVSKWSSNVVDGAKDKVDQIGSGR